MRASCSTTSTVSPSFSFSSPHDPEELAHDHRREPERRLVEQQEPRAAMSARPSASICCSPPESVPARWPPRSAIHGKYSATRSMSAFDRAVAAGVRAELEVLRRPSARRTCRGPRARARCPRCATASGPPCSGLPVELIAPVRRDRARDRAQRRRLAGAVRAEHRDDLALVDVERDVAERLHRPVPRRDAVQLEERASSLGCSSLARSRDRPRSRPGRPAPRRAGRPRSCARSSARSRGRRCSSRGSCGARRGGR